MDNLPGNRDRNCRTIAFDRGDRMSQAEFHQAYDEMPDGYRAELLGGVVYEPSPLGLEHGEIHVRLSAIFDLYRCRTPGVGVADNATVILGEEDEVQPDLFLRIQPDFGGQSKNIQLRSKRARRRIEYAKGAPELVAEIAGSNRAIDLHIKLERYKKAGVREYIVVCLSPERIYWFDLASNSEFAASEDGIFRSQCFPGLWIDAAALFQLDYDRSMHALNRGLDSVEHGTFALELAARKARDR